jgi:3-oxoacyl-[acyl-carrier protein] reductase
MFTEVTYNLSGRTAIVTGAARGIGRAVAELLASAGARTFALDLQEPDDPFEGSAAPAFRCADITDTGSVERVVADVHAETGRIDILVNNAGILRDTMIWKMTDEDWDAVLAVHAGGTFRMTRACAPIFRSQNYGRIINVTSYTGLHGNFGQSNYATAKAGIIGFTKTVAKELAAFGVSVNAISPNAATRMIESIPADKLVEVTRQIPMGRFAEAAEVAASVAFLASDAAGYITGAVVPVEGGLSM